MRDAILRDCQYGFIRGESDSLSHQTRPSGSFFDFTCIVVRAVKGEQNSARVGFCCFFPCNCRHFHIEEAHDRLAAQPTELMPPQRA